MSRMLVAACAIAGLSMLMLMGAPGSVRADASCLPGSLKSTLAQIRAKFGPIEVLSASRPGARTPGGKESLHASCRAVDFTPPPGKYAAVVAWLRSNHGGGLGTYSCGMHHIHIDNGPSYSWHTCGR